MSDPWIGLDQRDEVQSKVGVLARKLDGGGGENEVEVAPILEITRAEERGTKLSVRQRPFGDRFGDTSLPCPSDPVQPADGGLAKFLVQSSISSKTTPRVPLRQPLRSPCRNSCAQRKLLRTVASAIRDSCQAPVIKKGRRPNLGPFKRLFHLHWNENIHYKLMLLVINLFLLLHLLPCRYK